MSNAQANEAALAADHALLGASAPASAAARPSWWRGLAHWNGIDALQASIQASSRFAESKMPTLGVLCVIGHIVYFLIWTRVFPQAYESWGVRLAVVAVTAPILFIKTWPKSARRYLPLYWFIGITINLPGFFTYWAVMNQFNMVTVTSHLAALFLILMVFDLRASVASYALGFAGAAAGAYIAGAPPIPSEILLEMAPVWIFVVFAATLFSLSGAIEYQSRLDTVSATAATIAHELRTPLATIRLAATGSMRHLPTFVDAYRKARTAGLDVPLIQPAALKAIEQTGEALKGEVDHALVTIDMLLAAARPGQIHPLERVSAQELLQSAIRRYPFGSNQERDKIYFGALHDFTFLGSQPLLLNVIFNLLKNGIYHTSRVNKGDITLSVQHVGKHGEIVVHDTGPGIAPAFLPRIFERFSTSAVSSDIGLGIGLAFCKDAVERMHGEIRCESVLGEYSRFVLRFPLADAA